MPGAAGERVDVQRTAPVEIGVGSYMTGPGSPSSLRPPATLADLLRGDAHILNFGLWATPERNLSFDLRDFDETLSRHHR